MFIINLTDKNIYSSEFMNNNKIYNAICHRFQRTNQFSQMLSLFCAELLYS